MSSALVLFILVGYFLVLLTISHFTSKNSSAAVFFTANRNSKWYVVAFGMIGASLSGVTFISVPGWVGTTNFSYMQMVFGYLLGYTVIALVLMPLYYKLNLVTIYSYFKDRFGERSYTTAASFFLVSRVIGASFRLYLVAGVLQIFLFDQLGVHFAITVLVTIALIWLYTFKGGIKTIVWTDTLQTAFMLLAVVVSIYLIGLELNFTPSQLVHVVFESDYSTTFVWDWSAKNNFFKHFFSGAFIAIVMTGLDQDMMQKNLTCKSLGDAQKNVFWFSTILVVVNLLFVSLGALLYIYSEKMGIALPEKSDDLFATLAFNNFPLIAGITFLLGIIAAAYSSADSALTSLTTSFCVDFLKFDIHQDSASQQKNRKIVHLAFSIVLFLVIMLFKWINDDSVIKQLFTLAGYTYGPLLGLFAFGMFSKYQVQDRLVPWVCMLSPIICYFLSANYSIGFELLIYNGIITTFGLFLIREAPRLDPKKVS